MLECALPLDNVWLGERVTVVSSWSRGTCEADVGGGQGVSGSLELCEGPAALLNGSAREQESGVQ